MGKISSEVKIIRDSGVFDVDWYVSEYPDTLSMGMDPVEHYCWLGAKLLRNPSPLFQTGYYFQCYPDIAKSGLNPLVHFLEAGIKEGRKPNPLFDLAWYLKSYPDVSESGSHPLSHYQQYGCLGDHNPNPLFDSKWYIETNKDVSELQINPLAHFLYTGTTEGCNPNPLFHMAWYLEKYHDVAASGMHPLAHFLQFGNVGHHDPNPFFNTAWYLATYADVFASGENPLSHYLTFGKTGEYNPNPVFDANWYLKTYCGGSESGANPLVHYIQVGKEAGNHISPFRIVQSNENKVNKTIHDENTIAALKFSKKGGYISSDVGLEAVKICFDEDYYRAVYPDTKGSDLSPIQHYLSVGRYEFRNPCEHFDIVYYLHNNEDVLKSKVDPFEDYLISGWKEGRNPCERLNTKVFLDFYPEAWNHQYGPIGYLSTANPYDLLRIQEIVDSPHGPYFREKSSVELTNSMETKVFSFYLPQFHPIEENDNNWGLGFTDWTNVTKAKPRFFSHYQPKLPYDQGFYDLRLDENFIKQIELAKYYGLDGFCFYYYWFSGKKLLEKPLIRFLEKNELNFPFTLLWANENWTGKWDGKEDDVIIGQKYRDEDSVQFIKDIEHILLDHRYQKYQGKPILIVYRPDDIPNCSQWVKTWRTYWKNKGFGDLYLVCVQFLPDVDPREYGFDAMLQFPPNGFPNHGIEHKIKPTSKDFGGNFYSYDEMVQRATDEKYEVDIFRTSTPSWDNDARKPNIGDIFVGSSPSKFREWTIYNIVNAKKDNPSNIVFINAWNEWAESACLEPDRKYGYAHLEAVADAKCYANCFWDRSSWRQVNDSAIIVHVYYLEVLQSFIDRLEKFKDSCDFYFTLPPLRCAETIEVIKNHLPQANFFICENRGRDIRPFLKVSKWLSSHGFKYDYICKLHTKKSTHRIDGAEWLNGLVENLLPASGFKTIQSLIDLGNEKDIGIIAPKDHIITLKENMGGNEKLVDKLLKKVGCSIDLKCNYFVAGSMFWMNGSLLKHLDDELPDLQFAYERGQIDCTLAHAWERIFCSLANCQGMVTVDSDNRDAKTVVRKEYKFVSLDGYADKLAHPNSNILQSYPSIEQITEYIHGVSNIALFSVYRDSADDDINIQSICKWLRNEDFFVIVIDPTEGHQNEDCETDTNNFFSHSFIRRKNIGHDFGSWTEAIATLFNKENQFNEILLINDSCYLTGADQNLIGQARRIDADVVGLTESYQFCRHLQSNFLLFKTPEKSLELLLQFSKSYQNPTEKIDIILEGEIALSKQLTEGGFVLEPIFPYNNLTSIVRERYVNEEGPWYTKLLDKIQRGEPVHPHNYLADAIYEEMNCPLIKKEFIKRNPGKHPFIEKYRALLLKENKKYYKN